tara:strand:- start:40 stop:486 length:447 start_codon:yes stop_codon:yes gene_type:complete
MKIINSLSSLISFSIILLLENFLNLIVSNTYISISPFFILLFIFSLKRFSNRNIFPIMGSGILYDIFLSENYLGIYAIVFLLTAVSINYMYEKLIDFNFKLPFIFALNYLIYNIPNILNLNILSIIALSVFINYLIFILLKRVMRLSV